MSDIDCANRTHLCHAACCVIGKVVEDDGTVIKEDGPCPFLGEDLKCTRYETRPKCCRYDCRRVCSIWIDFERKVPNPDLEKLLNGLRLR